MLTKRRAIAALALVIFAGFCLGGWLFLRPYFDDKGAPMTWHEVSVDGQALTIFYQGDSCEDERSIEVHESGDEVVVTIFVKDKVFAIPFVVGCGSSGERFDIELDSPLAERTLLDGACLEHGWARENCVRTPLIEGRPRQH